MKTTSNTSAGFRPEIENPSPGHQTNTLTFDFGGAVLLTGEPRKGSAGFGAAMSALCVKRAAMGFDCSALEPVPNRQLLEAALTRWTEARPHVVILVDAKTIVTYGELADLLFDVVGQLRAGNLSRPMPTGENQ